MWCWSTSQWYRNVRIASFGIESLLASSITFLGEDGEHSIAKKYPKIDAGEIIVAILNCSPIKFKTASDGPAPLIESEVKPTKPKSSSNHL